MIEIVFRAATIPIVSITRRERLFAGTVKVLHDARVGIQPSERLTVGDPPRPQEEPGRPELCRQFSHQAKATALFTWV